MVKQDKSENQVKDESKNKKIKNSKYNRFDSLEQIDIKKKNTWPVDAVVYLGHIPHGFYENQLT